MDDCVNKLHLRLPVNQWRQAGTASAKITRKRYPQIVFHIEASVNVHIPTSNIVMAENSLVR